GKSNRRNRRPAVDELDMLIEALQQRSTHKCSKIPFVDILKSSDSLIAEMSLSISSSSTYLLVRSALPPAFGHLNICVVSHGL
ncbi:hypothetical protein ACSLOB_29405, partial [Escherichia coli]